MSNVQNQQLDISELRRKVSEIAGRSGGEADSPPVKLNPLARQVASQLRSGNHSPNIIIGQIQLLEFVGLVLLGCLINTFAADHTIVSILALLAIMGAGGALTGLLLYVLDLYQLPSLRTPVAKMPRILVAYTTGFALTVLLLLAFHPTGGNSWSMTAVWFAISAVFLVATRLITGVAIRHWGRNGVMERRAVIVGGGDAAKNLIRSLEEQPDNDIRICGIFDDRNSDRSPDIVAGYPKLGTFAELVEFARLTRLDMLIISLPITAEARILMLLKQVWVLPVDIRIAAHANKLRFRPRSYSHVGNVPMLDVFDKPIRDWDSVAKRIFDLFFTVVALLLLWPVMIGAAIAVKATSKGPVFFKQKRHGFNNDTINVWKFRSMYTELSDPTAKQAVTKNDPRVTPVGRFLRKSSIDELPQLFNVLNGSLSLVGPRPHAVLAQTGDLKYADVVESYFARHKVKPGVTGWAQINGWRGEIDNSDKIKFRTAFDLHYIENWSLLFDLKILFLTPIRLLKSENAY
ncbi:undecaprenyl-phosphate glucose phosphotransferase [Agrobacterium sp.]|uniref:undecaprenyl-phosphate glucose phosphotransferase n=1 Tax=Agrobacterium sp. TaxID=361 RepID=UPI0028B15871|nr:undecaprenyl-phosphate glucose phosphotransferase [Agrobacterium sp.]